MPWVAAVVGAAGSYLSAREQEKMSREASKPQTQTQTPYGNEYIARIFPYILANQQNVFESRMKGYGLDPKDFSPVGEQLAKIDTGYSGVYGKDQKPGFLIDRPDDVEPNPNFAEYAKGPDESVDKRREGFELAQARRRELGFNPVTSYDEMQAALLGTERPDDDIFRS